MITIKQIRKDFLSTMKKLLDDEDYKTAEVFAKKLTMKSINKMKKEQRLANAHMMSKS